MRAARRAGRVALCVEVPGRRPVGLAPARIYPSASVVKAMLLVAALRSAGRRPLTAQERGLLGPMVRRSRNRAARSVYARVGPAGLEAVGRSAGMRRLDASRSLFDTGVTAADQARFFLRIDRLVPARHRAYARALLGDAPSRASPAASRVLDRLRRIGVDQEIGEKLIEVLFPGGLERLEVLGVERHRLHECVIGSFGVGR